jgi:hypothetical protein
MDSRLGYDHLPILDFDSSKNTFDKSKSQGAIFNVVEQARITFYDTMGFPNSLIQKTTYVCGISPSKSLLYCASDEIRLFSDGRIESRLADFPMILSNIKRYEVLARSDDIFKASFGKPSG